MKLELYTTPPKQKYFDELKLVCIRYWNTFDDTFGYATEKINEIKDLENVGSNFMTMVKMIHPLSWELLVTGLSKETRVHISLRLEAGGHSLETDFFNIWGINEAKEKYGQLD